MIDLPRLCNFRPSSRVGRRFCLRFSLERVRKIEFRAENRKDHFDNRFSRFRGVRHCYRPWYIRGRGALHQSPDTLLVPLLSILVIKYWLVLEGALVQWQFLRELSKGYLCGHRYSLGTVLLLDDTQVLCVSWRLLPLRSATESAEVKPALASSCKFLLSGRAYLVSICA